MAIRQKYYIITAAVARRISARLYRTADGHYVADGRLLSQAGISPDDAGIEEVTREEALTLIARGGYNND